MTSNPTAEMSDEELRVKIEQVCPRIVNEGCDDEGQAWCWQDDAGTWHDCHKNDPLQDLNAIAEAERTLTDAEHKQFRGLLFSMNYDDGTTSEDAERGRVSATARQRTIAFLRTKGVIK